MKVSEFEDFDRLATEGLLTGSRERTWIWSGLVVSLAIHFALCAYFYRTRSASTEALAARSQPTPTSPAIAPAQIKGAVPVSAIWISCWHKKVRSDQAQNCGCRTISFSNMTATCCNSARSTNCKSWAL